MRRTIEVSTGVFSLIWARREPGEDTEDTILCRLLSEPKPKGAAGKRPHEGFFDTRHGVAFPEGFEIFRTYRGHEFRAIASGGTWWLSGSKIGVTSLNQLSRAVGPSTENAWISWFYLDASGKRQPISNLRQANKSDPSAREETAVFDVELGPDATWLDDVEAAFRFREHPMPLNEIYSLVRLRRQLGGRSRPTSLEAIIRRTLEENCSDTDSYKGKSDLFWMPEGKGAGIWGRRKRRH